MTARIDSRTAVTDPAGRSASESLGSPGICGSGAGAAAEAPSPPELCRAEDRLRDLGCGKESNAEEGQNVEGLVHHHEQAFPGLRWGAFDDADVANQQAAIVLENMGNDDQRRETERPGPRASVDPQPHRRGNERYEIGRPM